jgi:2-oxoglutarate dehydrogenase E1 component
MSGWQQFHGVNAGYLAELYERFRADPASVDPETREFFQTWTPPEEPVGAVAVPAPAVADLRAIIGAVSLADSIRRYGHLAAQLDP